MNGSRITEERNRLNLTQKELGDRVNISQKSISKYEKGQRSPSYETLVKLAEVFNVSTDYLLGNTDARAPYTADRGRSEPPEPLLTEKERNLLHAFRKLDSDDQDIVIGEAKKMVRENQRERNADSNQADRNSAPEKQRMAK